MKQAVLISFVLCAGTAFAAGYQPNDVNTFINTGKCPNCDLSMASLSYPMGQMIEKTNNQNFYMSLNLQNADLVGASITNSAPSFNLQNSNLTGLVGTNASFAADQMSGSIFINATLENTGFSHANLSNTDFTGADVKGADFSYANLYQAKISPQQLSQTTHCQTVLPNGTISQSCTG